MFVSRSILGAAAFVAGLSFAASAQAGLVLAYEWTEGGAGNGTLSTHQSRHGVGGPVLADDFTAARSGRVARIEWWGSAALTGNIDQFEVTFHNDAGGFPDDTDATGLVQSANGGISQHFVSSAGSDADGDGVFQFGAAWTPKDITLVAGTDYWFSVANAQGLGWLWADAGGLAPTVGSEQFTAQESTGVGPNGGPHFGPWVGLSASPTAQVKQDFAFRIFVEAPEPGTMAVFAVGLAGLSLLRRRKRTQQ